MESIRTFFSRISGRKALTMAVVKVCLFVVLVSLPVFVYLVAYVDTDCDDKAVHFYASAYLFGQAEKRQAIRERISDWAEAEEVVWRKQRFITRMTSAANYIAADVFIRAIRAWQLRADRTPADAPYYSWAVRIAFLAMLVAALCNLLVAGWRTPPGLWFILVVIAMVSFTVIRVTALVSGPRDTMHSFISYVPRGSATLFVLAMFLCYAADRKLHFVLSGVLLYLWHGGVSTIMFLVITPVLLAADCLGRRRSLYPLVTVVLFVIACAIARTTSHPLPPSAVPGWSAEELPAVWSSIVYATFFAGLAYMCLKTGVVNAWDGFGTRFLLVGVGFVVACGICDIIVAGQAVRAAIERVSGVHLVYELPKRLSGARYLVQSAVLVFIGWSLLGNYWRIQAGIGMCRRRLLALGTALGIALVLMVTVRAAVHSRPMHVLTLGRKPSFFRDDECEHVKATPVTVDTLSDLDPLQEPEFFYSLGEWLMEKEVISDQ